MIANIIGLLISSLFLFFVLKLVAKLKTKEALIIIGFSILICGLSKSLAGIIEVLI